VGWRDRDYARWTDEERRRFLDSGVPASSPSRPSVPARSRSRIGIVQGGFLAICVSALLFLLGHVPSNHPLVPGLDFRLPSPPGASHAPPAPAQPSGSYSVGRSGSRRIKLHGPTVVKHGSHLTLRGSVPSSARGQVVIDGSWNGGAWRILSVADGRSGSYRARLALGHTGRLRLRVLFANGDTAVGAMRVR
jgi:hypothetical protein